MVPIVNLKRQLELSAKMMSDYEDESGNGIDQDDANSLASLVMELNDWIMKGGDLPEQWKQARKSAW